ncbi:transmembrane protein, putative [Medicago truncatula]|uniref:Transmembrane protein, putative n=1 Tax=Medicago truncatula TaxID=3880 RepID=G7ZUQ5_MEDTR|nr:transmembrane protein, putative [Medicago truncatula]
MEDIHTWIYLVIEDPTNILGSIKAQFIIIIVILTRVGRDEFITTPWTTVLLIFLSLLHIF